jgi:hypothetical protein
LTDDLIKFGRAHSGSLQLLEQSASFDAPILPRIAYQQHTVLRNETREKLAHMVSASKIIFDYGHLLSHAGQDHISLNTRDGVDQWAI